MAFPIELVSRILREATLVPEALDTSPSIFSEDRDAVIQLVSDSMKTKASLSLVSKDFHDVMENYLYEIVMIFRFDHVPILLQRLRMTPVGFRNPRGHKCRRLDFYLGVGPIRYNDEAWYEGGHTLWGLLSACPNLEILMVRVVRVIMRAPPNHLTHKALWMTIAACCARSIRRLELYGLRIRMDRVEMMLRYLTKLEACQIIGVEVFDPNQDTYDDDEPKEYFFANGHNGSVTVMDTWDYSKDVSGWFDTDTVNKFKEAKEHSHWPPFVGSAPYTLPYLHTLRISCFDLKRFHHFNFPLLRHLDITSVNDDGLEICSAHQNFPTSITHFIYAGQGTSFAQIFHYLSLLRQLTVAIEISSMASSEYEFTVPHLHLEVVELACWYGPDDPQPFILDILTAVRAGKLPSLHLIRFTTYARCKGELPFEECDALGITLKVVRRPLLAIFNVMDQRHHT